jgi:hypothetical protein
VYIPNIKKYIPMKTTISLKAVNKKTWEIFKKFSKLDWNKDASKNLRLLMDLSVNHYYQNPTIKEEYEKLYWEINPSDIPNIN